MKHAQSFEYTVYFTENTNLDILEKLDGVFEISFNVDFKNDTIYFAVENADQSVNVEISINSTGCELDLFYISCLKDAYELIQPDHVDTFEILNDLRQFLKYDFSECWNEFYLDNDLANDVYESYPFEYFEFIDIFDAKIRELVSGIC